MIITFYSYKGGVGRTQLVANLAAYFCYAKAKKVLLIDWDLEAPGLHHYFNLKTTEINIGLIDLFLEYSKKIRKNELIEENELPFFSEKYILNLTKSKRNAGKIDLIAAGNYNNNYNQKINNFNWNDFYENQDGKLYIEFLKEKLNELNYDFIFIDSRTGVSDYSGICNIQFPEINIIVIAPTHQNFEGAAKIADNIINSPYITSGFRKPIIFPILSKIDLSVEYISRDWLQKFKNVFSDYLTDFWQTVDDYWDIALLDYKRDISFGEPVLFKDENLSNFYSSSLIKKYIDIAENFIEIRENRHTSRHFYASINTNEIRELIDEDNILLALNKLLSYKSDNKIYNSIVAFFKQFTNIEDEIFKDNNPETYNKEKNRILENVLTFLDYLDNKKVAKDNR